MARSLKVHHQCVEKVKLAVRRNGFRSQRALAEDVGLALATVSNFLTGKPVDFATFAELAQRLSLSWRDIADLDFGVPSQVIDEDNHTKSYQDWGEAVDVSQFYGRREELETLEKWIGEDHCRLIALVGMGGIGKTSLSVKIAQLLQPEFEFLIWRSLRNAPPLNELLNELINFLSHQKETNLPESLDGKVASLINYLRSQRCLLVLDNAESILLSDQHTGAYREGYEGYGHLLRCWGETNHQSCLVLTTREKPRDISIKEGIDTPIRSLSLLGLTQQEGQKILAEKGLSVSEEDCQTLVDFYAGNPLALKIVGTTINELFDGDVSQFLAEGTIIFGDIADLLDQQFNRLSSLEKRLMYWLTINREWVSFKELQQDIIPPVSFKDLLAALESLRLRSLIEKNSGKFTQQPVVMEYVVEGLIEGVCQEIETGQIGLLGSFSLIKAQGKDYIRNSQIQLILKPITTKLLSSLGIPANVQSYLDKILATLKSSQPRKPGYAGGNLLNLLWQLGIDLDGYDFSNLSVWQAYLQGMNLHRVNFANADLTRSAVARTLGGVFAVTFSPDGKQLATSLDNEVWLWEVATLKHTVTYSGHTAWVQAVAFSADGEMLASGSNDQTVRLWNIKTGQCWKTLRGHTGLVQALAFSADGEMLASGSNDQTVRLWNIKTGQCLSVLSGHRDRVFFTCFHPDGKTLVTGGEDQTVRLWDIQTGYCVKVMEVPINWILAIALSPDGQTLVTGSDHTTVKFWDLDEGKCIKTLPDYHSKVWSVVYSPDGQNLVTGSEDTTVKIWDVATGKCLQTLHENSNSPQGNQAASHIWLVAMNPDGQSLLSINENQTMRLWDLTTGQCLRTVVGYSNWLLSIAFSPDGQIFASSGEDKQVRLWNVETGQCLRILSGHSNFISTIAFLPQSRGNKLVLASGSDDTTIKLWDISTGECLQTLWGHEYWVHGVSFSSDGNILASGSGDQTIKLWDWQTGECLQTLQGHSQQVKTIGFSSDGKVLASGSDDTTIKLWDVSTGECLQTLSGHRDWVLSVAFCPGGNILASGSGDGKIKLWDLETGKCLQTLSGHGNRVRKVAFSPDGKVLASGSDDTTVKLWDLETGEIVKTLQGHDKAIRSIAFSPDGQVLVSGGEDETLKVWELEIGECVKTMRVDRPYEGMNIKNTSGLTVSQKNTLKALGAID